ncbi:unnamed protein product, partial [Acidithrix sp. C25]
VVYVLATSNTVSILDRFSVCEDDLGAEDSFDALAFCQSGGGAAFISMPISYRS